MPPLSLTKHLEDLRTREYGDIASTVEEFDLCLGALQAVARNRFPIVLDGSFEQAEIVRWMAPYVMTPNVQTDDEEDDDSPAGGGHGP